MTVSINIEKAKQTVINLLKANIETQRIGTGVPLIPYLKGSPALGKSATVRAIAEHFKLKLIDIRLPQEDPVCLNGALSVTGNRSTFLPPERFPLESDAVPEGYQGWLIFFDEIADAPRSIQSAAYRILLEREIGAYKLHSKAFMVAAGNRVSDRAGASVEMSSALKSRLVHIPIHSDAELFLDKITSWGWDLRIRAYLQHKPNQTNTFHDYISSNSADDTYRSERTWDMVNCYLRAIHPDMSKPIPLDEIVTLTGMIGSQASEFVHFANMAETIPQVTDIIADPMGTTIPENEGAKFLLATILATHMVEENHREIMQYVQRLGNTFTFPCVRNAWLQNYDVWTFEAIKPWIAKLGNISRMAK